MGFNQNYTDQDGDLHDQVIALHAAGRMAWEVVDCGHRTDDDDLHTGYSIVLQREWWEHRPDGHVIYRHVVEDAPEVCWYSLPDTARGRQGAMRAAIEEAIERNSSLTAALEIV